MQIPDFLRTFVLPIHLLPRDTPFFTRQGILYIFSQDGIHHRIIGLVHQRRVKRSQIDACRILRIVPHGLADDRERNVFALGDVGPTMAGYIQSRYI